MIDFHGVRRIAGRGMVCCTVERLPNHAVGARHAVPLRLTTQTGRRGVGYGG